MSSERSVGDRPGVDARENESGDGAEENRERGRRGGGGGAVDVDIDGGLKSISSACRSSTCTSSSLSLSLSTPSSSSLPFSAQHSFTLSATAAAAAVAAMRAYIACLLFFATRRSFIRALSSRVRVHAHAFVVLTVDDAGGTRVAIGPVGVGSWWCVHVRAVVVVLVVVLETFLLVLVVRNV